MGPYRAWPGLGSGVESARFDERASHSPRYSAAELNHNPPPPVHAGTAHSKPVQFGFYAGGGSGRDIGPPAHANLLWRGKSYRGVPTRPKARGGWVGRVHGVPFDTPDAIPPLPPAPRPSPQC